MEQALKLAIDCGWQPTKPDIYWNEGIKTDIGAGEILLDPSFWQALGKSLGWGLVPDMVHALAYSMGKPIANQKWLFEWHSFIDHLAKGNDADSFFTNLLTQSHE